MAIETHRSLALSHGQRLMALVAAVAVTGAIFSAVVVTFGAASPATWLAPTPEVMELAARCDRQPDRAQRDRCKQQLVDARLAGEDPGAPVAQAPRDPSRGRLVRR